MSHRAAKRIRKLTGLNIRDRRYASAENNVRLTPSKELDDKGLSKQVRFEYTGTVQLHPQCGRAKYQAMKRAHA